MHTLCTIIMDLLNCDYVVDQYYLHADYSVQCYTTRYWKNVMWWSLPFLTFVVGIPLSIFVMLRKVRTRMNEPKVFVVYGFLYGAYDRSIWWLEIYDMTNKLFFTGIMTLLPARMQVGCPPHT